MSAALATIQRELERLNDVEAPPVSDFLLSVEQAHALYPGAVTRKETLLVGERDGELDIGLYLDDDVLTALDEEDWLGDAFPAFCLAAEGVSHFLYLVFRARHGDKLTQLELELQAEVDKFALPLLASTFPGRPHPISGFGVGLIQERVAMSRSLRRRLFDEVEFLDAKTTEEGVRYRDANRFAARYSANLETCLEREGFTGLVRELRRFFRAGSGGKVARTY